MDSRTCAFEKLLLHLFLLHNRLPCSRLVCRILSAFISYLPLHWKQVFEYTKKAELNLNNKILAIFKFNLTSIRSMKNKLAISQKDQSINCNFLSLESYFLNPLSAHVSNTRDKGKLAQCRSLLGLISQGYFG